MYLFNFISFFTFQVFSLCPSTYYFFYTLVYEHNVLVSLSELIFAQFPKVANSIVEDSTSANDSPSDSPNYTELGDGQVMDILKEHIGVLNSGDGLVLFKGAIEHAARICRAMVCTLCTL